MYCLEGEITTRVRPETLIGEFGAFHTDVVYDPGRTDRTFSSTGAEEFVEASIRQWMTKDGVAAGVPIELISDVQAAEKYTPPKEEQVGLEYKEGPSAVEVLQSRIPEECELLVATLALWHETRRPFLRHYRSAEGTLLGLLNFDIAKGWYEPHDEVMGDRQVQGIATRRRHEITVVDHIEAVDTAEGSPYPYMTVSDQRSTSKSDRARFLNITKALRTAN